jgi:hypothetical protein
VDSVGRSELHAVESFLIQALAHRLKIEAFPGAKYPIARWQLDAEMFRQEAIQRFAPSMRRNLDIDKIYRRARRWVPAEIDGQPALPLPEQSPVTLDEMLSEGA